MEKKSCSIFVLGNPFLKEDALPLQLLPQLRKTFPKVQFVELDPTENLPEKEHLIIIDTILNTSKVIVWDNIDAIHSSPSYSLHDFDLGMNLKLMKKLGKLKKVTIIGIPPSRNKKKIVSELIHVISNLLSKNEWRN